ncbi:hypothetical protein LPJ56_006468, partial [Coemansia sp. RSA 2599]
LPQRLPQAAALADQPQVREPARRQAPAQLCRALPHHHRNLRAKLGSRRRVFVAPRPQPHPWRHLLADALHRRHPHRLLLQLAPAAAAAAAAAIPRRQQGARRQRVRRKRHRLDHRRRRRARRRDRRLGGHQKATHRRPAQARPGAQVQLRCLPSVICQAIQSEDSSADAFPQYQGIQAVQMPPLRQGLYA